MHTFDLSMEHITKIEGNASVKLKVENNKVKDVKFATEEYKRFFTEALKDKPLAAIPAHLSRICGTCSNSHIMCAIEACENVLGIKATEQTKLMRNLMMHGLMIRDHALHLYLFAMPDIFGKDAFLEFDESDPIQHKLLHDGFDVKSAGNFLATLIAGRSVHATLPTIGGFLKFPEPASVNEAIERLKNVRPAVLRLIEIFKNAPFHFDRQTKYMALVPEKTYGYINGVLETSAGEKYEEKDFRSHLEKTVIPYSQAIGYKYEGEGYMVGALARLNLAKDKLHTKTKKSATEVLKLFPSTDIFYNNLAQAIEILHSVDESIDLLSQNTFKPEEIIKAEPKNDIVGVGVVEAPRGTLYHKIIMGKNGKAESGEVIVPTGQNQVNIERDIGVLVQNLLNKPEYADNLEEDKRAVEFEIEKLIRAYDPCMSCAAHFLVVDWNMK
ncbi:MAG: nickel-dependent hydrogenase large subunit [Candidatus Zambryskibacteria bacterium]|nr:nickel-dependent hydrogenase large subunit [Candidatus Zambryskibacteria bacterium]